MVIIYGDYQKGNCKCSICTGKATSWGIKIRTEHRYDSIEIAAMKAANNIYKISSDKNNEFEYGIAVYRNQRTNKYHLTDMRKGERDSIKIDHELKIRGEEYRFVAHVHTHPIKQLSSYEEFIAQKPERPYYEQVFSLEDYILSRNINYICFLVAHLKHIPYEVADFVQCKTTPGDCAIYPSTTGQFQCRRTGTIDESCTEMMCTDGTNMKFSDGILMMFDPKITRNIRGRGRPATMSPINPLRNEFLGTPAFTVGDDGKTPLFEIPKYELEERTENYGIVNGRINTIIEDKKRREIFSRYNVKVTPIIPIINNNEVITFKKINYPIYDLIEHNDHYNDSNWLRHYEESYRMGSVLSR